MQAPALGRLTRSLILRTLTGVQPGKASSVISSGTKLLTFQTWVTGTRWYDYAVAYPDLVPYPLIDRSPARIPSSTR